MTSVWATKIEDRFLSETRHWVSQGETDLSSMLQFQVTSCEGALARIITAPPQSCTSCHLKHSLIQCTETKQCVQDLVYFQVCNANSPGGLFNREKIKSPGQGLWKPRRVSDLFTLGWKRLAVFLFVHYFLRLPRHKLSLTSQKGDIFFSVVFNIFC